MGLDVNVLQLMIAYNQAQVYQANNNYSLASQLYKFIAGTIGSYLSSGKFTDATLTHLAMRAHNNMGQIEYNERSEESAHTEFENALAYARHHYNNAPRQAGDADHHLPSSTTRTTSIEINSLTTPAEHQLEIATVLSNWCRTRWMMGRVDENVYAALEDILQIRSTHLGKDHPDVAVAHFNLGRAEYSRHSNQKALKDLLQYMRISSHRFQKKNIKGKVNNSDCDDEETVEKDSITDDGDDDDADVELDPIQGLIYVLQIQNEEKDDDVSQDLVWGLRTLQDKRQDLGPIHTDVASVLNFIGTLLFRRQELDYALCFFAQELRVEEQLKSQSQSSGNTNTNTNLNNNDDVSISVTCNNIGRILQELGRYPEAKYYYQRSLGDKKNNTPNTCTRNCCTVQKQKCILKNKNKNKAASDIDIDDYNDTSDIPAAAMNLYSTVWYNLGLIHDKMGAFKEAIRAFRMSLKLRRAMLGYEHSDVSCLLYNIGVLQMEQHLLDEATESFREALAHRHVAGKGQLNDIHVIKTLQKLSSMHKAKGNVKGALEAYRDILSVLTTSNDFDAIVRNRKTAIVLRDIADLHQAQGNLQLALKHAMGSVDLFRSIRTTTCCTDDDNAMDIDNNDNSEEKERSYVEEETSSLLLVGSLQHELCEPMNAQNAFTESARLVHSTLSTSVVNSTATTKLAATLLPLLEVSMMLSSASCAPKA